MNTFVPSEDLNVCAQQIHILGGAKRVHKQVAECGQMLRVIDKIYRNERGGWQRHPAVLMWIGYDDALFAYMLAIDKYRVDVLGSFRHKEVHRCLAEFPEYDEHAAPVLPPWWGGPIHESHRQVLQAKGNGFTHAEYKHLYYWPTNG